MAIEKLNALVIGRRDNGQSLNIGGELCTRLTTSRWHLGCVLTSSLVEIHNDAGVSVHVYDPTNPQEFKDIVEVVKPHIGFVCIPTRDCGETALAYTRTLIDAGAKVATAEKGMAAWQFDKIRPFISSVDLSAAVGGGNAFLYTLKRRHLKGRRITIRAVLNTTNNNIAWEVGDGGSSIDWAVRIASMIGIAEPLKPGQKPNPITIINGELWDTVLKICALMNFVFADDEYLLPTVFGEPAQINEHDLARITSVNDRRRVVVTITNIPSDVDDDDDLIAPMHAQFGQYHITFGFKSIRTGTVLDKWLPAGINNGVLLKEDGHVYYFGGPGAGPATVDALMIGAKELLNID